MNKVILMGRLTRDPDVRVSTGERPMTVARYTLAVDRRAKRDSNEQTADFISCVAFDKNAEFVEKYLHQGTKVLVTGRIQTGSYTNKEGHKVYTTDVMIEEQEFCESRAAGQGLINRPSTNTSVGDGFMNFPDGMDDEGLPFT